MAPLRICFHLSINWKPSLISPSCQLIQEPQRLALTEIDATERIAERRPAPEARTVDGHSGASVRLRNCPRKPNFPQ